MFEQTGVQTVARAETSVDDAATSATAWKSNFVALPSPRHRRDAGRESQLWGSSQILSYFIRLVIAARRTLSVDERLGSPHVGSARRLERACPCSMAWVFHQSIQHHGRAVAEK